MAPGLTGYNHDETILDRTDVSGLQLLWTTRASNIAGVSALVEDGGTLFVESTPSSAAYLTAVDESSGAQLWTTELYDYGPTAGIAAGDGLVFAPCETNGNIQNQAMCAFSESSGEKVWSYSHSCNCTPASYAATPPVYDNGVVYYGYRYGGNGMNGYFIAADAASGEVLWTYGCARQCGLSFTKQDTPAVAEGIVYLSGCHMRKFNGGVCALNAATGAFLWDYQDGSGGPSAVSAVEQEAFMAQNLNSGAEVVTKLSFEGSPLWTRTVCPSAGCPGLEPPAVGGGHVYVRGTDHELYALDSATGKVLWVSAPTCGEYEDSSPSVADGVVYIGADGRCGDTDALNASSGNVLWRASARGAKYGAPPIVLNGTLYAQCYDLCAYGLSDAARKAARY
jgi:eukaryotic-like serine/threonine-protein kinase